MGLEHSSPPEVEHETRGFEPKDEASVCCCHGRLGTAAVAAIVVVPITSVDSGITTYSRWRLAVAILLIHLPVINVYAPPPFFDFLPRSWFGRIHSYFAFSFGVIRTAICSLVRHSGCFIIQPVRTFGRIYFGVIVGYTIEANVLTRAEANTRGTKT